MDQPFSPQDQGEARFDHSGTVLVVDDEEFNLDMLSRRLARTGFDVRVANSGKEALRLIGETDFDLVLLDQMMPEMSGTDVLHTLRAGPATQTLPVIMVTAVASSDKITAALDEGANDYVTKPIDYKVALARIRSQLARRRTEISLRQSEERYALVAEASQEGLWDWNLCTGVVYYSPRWREMLGLDGTIENTADAWFSRIVAADRELITHEIEEYLESTKDVLKCAYRMRSKDGSSHWMSCHAITTRDQHGKPVRLAGAQTDVTEEKTHDLLTGLPNRMALISRLEFAMEKTASRAKDPASEECGHAVLFLDLNEFKLINDTMGHLAGDDLLKSIARRLLVAGVSWTAQDGNLQPPLVARMGGDEFAILLEGATTEASVSRFANHIKQCMENAFDLAEVPVHCTFSIGGSVATKSHKVPEDILREADIAMYSTKVEGLHKFALFDRSMRDIATQQLKLENDIRNAIAGDELMIAYQPKVDLDTGATYGVEALVRWNHPSRGLLQPSVFIPIAEKTGAIIPIGAWILRQACTQVGIWNAEFLNTRPLTLSVNLSPREFKQSNLIEGIRETLSQTGFPPALLHFEVTEGVLFGDIMTARETLNQLKSIGVGLDLDDFGTGYSSLQYLRDLPFDTLKIDQSFIAGLDPSEAQSGELVRTILKMASILGLEVVAEGIETEQHQSTLRGMGCRFGQGYFFAKPLACEAFHDLLMAERSPKSAAKFSPARLKSTVVALQEQA
jgi:diguanylate cyclase (GGDEF)-like protein/PAS domain S-box-containing protein